ncbi:hypothetical protein HMPREF2942_02390 [Rothia sp. HMSC071C12]|nr:hypothetical protein HMPREF2942_02390 [Rothia sp. HMSC071C12]
MVRLGQKMERYISGRHTENGIARYMLNMMVAGVDGIMMIKAMIRLNMNLNIMEQSGKLWATKVWISNHGEIFEGF